jgi:hypothetical protein
MKFAARILFVRGGGKDSEEGHGGAIAPGNQGLVADRCGAG